MRVVIAGGHGQIALLLERLLADRGDTPVGIVRNPDHVPDVTATGAEAVVLDLEEASVSELAEQLSGADAVVFAAGAGPGSGIERKETVDKAAAVLLADAAERAGVPRYVMISARRVDDPTAADQSNPVFAAYLRAKAAADQEVRARRSLQTTIVRPGKLTDETATGRVRVARQTGTGSIPRADVAAMVAETLNRPETAGHTFELVSGDTSIDQAFAQVAGW
ncbi:NAD(P)H-binding protein [Haloglycomyces albus]|uniref:NAD(P)H-binding protein n=1 Tax=Haloglycomyces albus TaxID=526067 RepID=UPI00046CBDBC|nr:NAD(P)H-binding protein [Haloglycomyces albus]